MYTEIDYDKHLEYFNKSEIKFSSILLEIESLRSLNYTYSKQSKKLPKDWLSDMETFLDDLLSQIHLRVVGNEIKAQIKRNKKVLELKSLDATHLATALHIQKAISEELVFCSLDEKLRLVAKKLGFTLYPKT